MSSLRPQDRKSLCRFTFADGRQCRTPRSPHHPHFCSDHARKDSQARAADKLARELSYFFSGQYLSACDLGAALGRLLPAVVRGDIKSRSARTLAYLSQTLAQAIPLSKHEYINAFGTDSWRRSVRPQFRPPKLQPSPSLPTTPTATGSGSPCSGRSSDRWGSSSPISPAIGPIATRSLAQHGHRIHSACSGRSSQAAEKVL